MCQPMCIVLPNQQVEVLSSLTGDLRVSIPNVCQDDIRPEDDAIVGLHLFGQQRVELAPRYLSFLDFIISSLCNFLMDYHMKHEDVHYFFNKSFCAVFFMNRA